MNQQYSAKTTAHLIRLILNRNGETPNFSLLLGAGASSTSAVQTAQQMILDWRRLLYEDSEREESFPNWLETQNWNGHEDEYSILFETIYDQPSQRRVRIEECVKGSHPSWGYVYLTNLLANRLFDVIFTTNFDDLINEACYLYSNGLRPIVAAHDSAIQGIRVTSGRPKIIKLHGDFLYDNIKNTLAELETLEVNTERKLSQFAQEYGLVVVGYSGRDRSVMDTLEVLLRDEENYKQGVYWCLRKGSAISDRLKSLVRKDRVYLVEIDGFDEFMAELHTKAQLALPKPIASPFEMARERARLFVDVEDSFKSHPIIGAHITEVLININSHSIKLPLMIEAASLTAAGRYDEAIPKWRQAHLEDPNDEHLAHSYADVLVSAGRTEELATFIPDAPLLEFHKAYYLLIVDKNQQAIDVATNFLNRSTNTNGHRGAAQALARINRAIAYKRAGNIEGMTEDLDFLELNGDTEDIAIRAGVAALRKDRNEMLNSINEALMRKELSPQRLREFPVFEDFMEDIDFMKLAGIRNSNLPSLTPPNDTPSCQTPFPDR